MNTSELLLDAFGRIQEVLHETVEHLDEKLLARRPEDAGNSIAWLVWHLTRIQDDHVCAVAGTEQVWTSAGWADRFALPFDASATGYGHSTEDVAAVKAQSGAC